MSIVALISEVMSGYDGSFLAYEIERLVPWSIAFVTLLLLSKMLNTKQSLR
jgi:hypothetical protein